MFPSTYFQPLFSINDQINKTKELLKGESMYLILPMGEGMGEYKVNF